MPTQRSGGDALRADEWASTAGPLCQQTGRNTRLLKHHVLPWLDFKRFTTESLLWVWLLLFYGDDDQRKLKAYL